MYTDKEAENRIITIPNLLSAFRLVLIPVFLWTYCIREEYLVTAGLLLLSGLTDLADGFIARRFHMVSNLGKMLDPVADKLTQAAMLICLVTRFPMVTTALLYLMIVVHLIWFHIPAAVSNGMIAVCFGVMLFSWATYIWYNIKSLTGKGTGPKKH